VLVGMVTTGAGGVVVLVGMVTTGAGGVEMVEATEMDEVTEMVELTGAAVETEELGAVVAGAGGL
jgi:hypothetical protein